MGELIRDVNALDVRIIGLAEAMPASAWMSTRASWMATAAHLHEQFGQLIAYARSNDVPPPWSK